MAVHAAVTPGERQAIGIIELVRILAHPVHEKETEVSDENAAPDPWADPPFLVDGTIPHPLQVPPKHFDSHTLGPRLHVVGCQCETT